MSMTNDIQQHIKEMRDSGNEDLILDIESKVNAALEFQLNLKLSKLIWEERPHCEDDICWAIHLHIGSITVLDRMTGFSFGRDIESGFRDPQGNFWLASGDFDIRTLGDITVREAIEIIKESKTTYAEAKQ